MNDDDENRVTMEVFSNADEERDDGGEEGKNGIVLQEEEQQQQPQPALDEENNQSLLSLLGNCLRNNPDQLTAMISNYSTSYNAVNVGIVLPVLKYAVTQAVSNNSNMNNSSNDEYLHQAHDASFHSSMTSLSRQLLQLIRLLPSPHRQGLIAPYLGSAGEEEQDEEEEEEDSIVASSLLAGMIVGQLIGGALGDVLGRRNAMMLVMALQIGASLGSALFISLPSSLADSSQLPDYDYDFEADSGTGQEERGWSPLDQLALWRFFLGVGAGGVYPLAAVMSAENRGDLATHHPLRARNKSHNHHETIENDQGHGEDCIPGQHLQQKRQCKRSRHSKKGYVPASSNENSSFDENDHDHHQTSHSATTPLPDRHMRSSFQRIALTFSTQGIGFLTVPLLAYPMLKMKWNINVIWRVLLGVGALPGLILMYLRAREVKPNDRLNTIEEAAGTKLNDNPVTEQLKEKKHNRNQGGSLELALASNDNGQKEKEEEKNEDEHNITRPESIKNIEETTSTSDPISRLFFQEENNLETNPTSVTTSLETTTTNDNELPLVEYSHLESDDNADNNTGEVEHFTQTLDDFVQDDQQPSSDPVPGLWASIKNEPNLGRKFIGTAGTWFLFDVLFYGNTLFEPLVLEAAFGSDSQNATNNNDDDDNAATDHDDVGYSLLQTAVRDSLAISLLSLPGYFVTVFLIGRRTCISPRLRSFLFTSPNPNRFSSCLSFLSCHHQTPCYIQMQGFLLMSLLYFIIGNFWTALSQIQWLLLLLYGGTFFFANYGPNTTTFLLPSVTYSEQCRSTLNGMSAAAGKLGALMGASFFEPAAKLWGENVVMVCCATISLIAWVLTRNCVGGLR